MILDRKTILICVVCLWLGSYCSSSSAPDVTPQPLNNRPILRWVARAAKTLLWVSLAAEGPPKPEAQQLATHATGEINFGEGW